ncbi:MAG: glycoside hydrolase family 5 protein [Oscillospiraceae bacterium]|nr:glycoside hydrolase family 5 protein [Oscillospiraceae bacterium]
MVKKNKLKCAAMVMSIFMMVGCFIGCSGQSGKMRDITTMELVQDMGLGINLGNTMESTGGWINSSSVTNYETGWGSPVITKEMIEGYKDSGFGVLRVPVAWSNMMSEDYEINHDYLARVTEIVDWALESGMYVILNIHWDGGWFSNFANEEDRDECMNKYKRIWEQLSEAYKNYSDYLMFESLNEEGGWDELWNRYSNEGDKELSYGILNEINQTFVDTVRESGGNNAKRHLLIAGYNTDITLTCDSCFKMPEDPAERCAVSVHYYTPSTFAILEADADWGKARTEWGTEADYEELNANMDLMKETFIDKGIPVIIGEYGTSTKNKTNEMIRLYLSSVCEAAYTRGMCPVLWDVTDVFYLRNEAKFKDSELLSELMAVKEFERE